MPPRSGPSPLPACGERACPRLDRGAPLRFPPIGVNFCRGGTANSSPPPCGEGSGVGVDECCTAVPLPPDPPPQPSPTRGEGVAVGRPQPNLAPMAPCLRFGRWDAPAAGTWFAAVQDCDPAGAHIPQTTARDDGVIFF